MTVERASQPFTAKDGRIVLLRSPRWTDLDDLLAFINSLVEEGAEILRDQPVTREEEAEWLGRRLAQVANGEVVWVVAEIDGAVVASADLTPGEGYSQHVGTLGLAVKWGYRDIGVGSALLTALISHAKAKGLQLLTLTVFSSNARAIHVYERAGFRETGRIPRGLLKDGTYRDHVLMTKPL